MSERENRIICTAQHSKAKALRDFFFSSEIGCVFFEPCRAIRKKEQTRLFGIPKKRETLSSWSGDRYYLKVAASKTQQLIDQLTKIAQLQIPGSGSLVVQELLDDEQVSAQRVAKTDTKFAEVTAILSLPQSGEVVGKTALDYGIGVPVVTFGEGTGIRDRMGLLRITIPPEKEIVRLFIARHDIDSVFSILIENGMINRPGGGFLYSSPANTGIPDTNMIIGRQKSPASIEQVVAAIDQLKGSTDWRKRNSMLKNYSKAYLRNQYELTVTCPEGEAQKYIQAMISAGAGGATVSEVQTMPTVSQSRETSAWKRIISLTSPRVSRQIINTLNEIGVKNKTESPVVEIQPVLQAYTYRPSLRHS